MDEFAEIVIWVLVIVLAIVAITAGPTGLKAWWKAKFLGQPGKPLPAQPYAGRGFTG